MKNKKAQLRNFEDWFKGFISIIFGIIFVTAIIKISPPELVSTFKNLGAFLIIVGLIILIISLVPRRYFH